MFLFLYNNRGCVRSKLNSLKGAGCREVSSWATTGSRCESSSSGSEYDPSWNFKLGFCSDISPWSIMSILTNYVDQKLKINSTWIKEPNLSSKPSVCSAKLQILDKLYGETNSSCGYLELGKLEFFLIRSLKNVCILSSPYYWHSEKRMSRLA